jgi:hypothetical protein
MGGKNLGFPIMIQLTFTDEEIEKLHYERFLFIILIHEYRGKWKPCISKARNIVTKKSQNFLESLNRRY